MKPMPTLEPSDHPEVPTARDSVQEPVRHFMIAEKISAKIQETKTHHVTKTGLKEIAEEVRQLESKIIKIPTAVVQAIKEHEDRLSDGFGYYGKPDTLDRIADRVLSILSNAEVSDRRAHGNDNTTVANGG